MKFSLDLKIREAERKASEIIREYGIYHPEHIRVRDIAFDLGVRIIEGRLVGASARLVRLGRHATIRLPDHETNIPRKRFSIAHDLGHFVLGHGGLAMDIVCGDDDMMNWYKCDEETEANFFAAELLMPELLVRKRCDVKTVSVQHAINLAENFRTSFTAAAIRFVKFCPEPCALVCSENNHIKWFYKSDEWWPFIQKGRKIDSRSLASDFFTGKEVYDKPLEVEAAAWLDTSKIKEITENSISLGRYGCVLTLLWIKP